MRGFNITHKNSVHRDRLAVSAMGAQARYFKKECFSLNSLEVTFSKLKYDWRGSMCAVEPKQGMMSSFDLYFECGMLQSE